VDETTLDGGEDLIVAFSHPTHDRKFILSRQFQMPSDEKRALEEAIESKFPGKSASYSLSGKDPWQGRISYFDTSGTHIVIFRFFMRGHTGGPVLTIERNEYD
jgi:hypothetical protein